MNLSSREGWIYPAEGQCSCGNPGFTKFGCLDVGACQVIRDQNHGFAARLLQSLETASAEVLV